MVQIETVDQLKSQLRRIKSLAASHDDAQKVQEKRTIPPAKSVNVGRVRRINERRLVFDGMLRERVAEAMPRQPRCTDIEAIIYALLDEPGLECERQKRVGAFRADAFVPRLNLVIEADGDYWHSLPGAEERDARKDSYLRELGYRVLRIRGSQIIGLSANDLKEML